ncbi:hypothetical protein Vi05172_g4576 [Venturia inaequalis]|nr:hypothetical protein Vi05172_g4576 [Venturia inaequalis]
MFFNTPSIIVMLSTLLITANAAPSQQLQDCYAEQLTCDSGCRFSCWNVPTHKTFGKSTPWCCS